MKKKSFAKLFIITLLFFNSFVARGSEKPDSLLLLKQLNSAAIQIAMDSTENFEQFSFLDKSIKESRIIGLGEATHGTHDFVKGNTEIIKYLITHKNFKVVVFESQYGGTDLLNKYIKGEDVKLNSAIYNIGFLNLMNYDILNFAKWLREYNANKKQEKQVVLYGCDSQSARYVVDDLMKFLDEHQSLSKELKEGMIDLRDNMHKTSHKQMKQTLKLLERSFKSLNANDEIMQRLQIVIQSVDLATSSALGRILKRDQLMSLNCKWIFNYNHQNKMAIYAHNAHIAKTSDNSMKKPMGQYISQLYPDFFVIGTGFNQGTVKVQNMGKNPNQTYKSAIDNSYDFFFTQCKYPAFYLDFGLLNNTELKSYVGIKNLSRNIGTGYFIDNAANVQLNYRKHVLSKSYDAMLYIKESTPTRLIFTEKL